MDDKQTNANYYNPTPFRQKRPIGKYLLIGLVVIIVIAGITVLILHVLMQAKSASTATVTPATSTASRYTKVVNSPDTLLQTYAADQADALQTAGYAAQTTTIINPTVLYKNSSMSYGVRVTPPYLVSYDRTDTSVATNDATVLNGIATFLVSKGLTQSGKTTLTGSSITTFDSANLVCQVGQYSGSSELTASFNIGCVTHTALQSEVSTIDSLLLLYTAGHTLPTVTDITRTYITSGGDKLNELLVDATGASPSAFTLYFATTGKTFSYIGTQAEVSIDSQTNPKPSSDLVAALKNPAYGTFLTSNIQLNQ